MRTDPLTREESEDCLACTLGFEPTASTAIFFCRMHAAEVTTTEAVQQSSGRGHE